MMDLDIDAFYRDTDAKVVINGATYRDYFPAVMRAMKSWNNRRASWTEDYRGFTLRFGPDDYWFSNSIHLIRGMRLRGAGGSGSWTGTRFFFSEGVHGIVSEFIKTPADIPDEFRDVPGRSDGSMIEGIYLEAAGKGVAEQHGILMIGSLILRDVTISGFSGDGVHINATLANKDARDYGNASGWLMENCNIFDCRNGVFVEAAGDNSAGTATRILVNNNLEWGIVDLSTTGSTYIGCIAHNNKAGSYQTRLNPGQSTTNSSLFLNCYAEGDQPPAKIGSPAMVIGGIMNLSEDSSAIWLNADNSYATFPRGMQAYSKEVVGKPTVIGMLGSQDERVALALHASKTPPDIYPYKLQYEDNGWWELHAAISGVGSRSPIKFSTNAASTAKERVNVWFEHGYFIGSGDVRKKVEMMQSPPATDDWEIGDQIWNANPTVGGYIGWVYVADPTDPDNPAKYTWHGFGKIE